MKEPIILQGDALDIQVYSGTLNQEQVQVFVLGNAGRTGYTVDAEGNINMPVLGKINVEGLEKPAMEKILLQKLEPYVKNPVVNISFMNFRVLTLGDVGSQGFKIMNEKSTVLDAIGMAGGLTDAGRRTDILLIRQLPGGKKSYTRLNLNDASIFASPYFQLQQNDVIYVLPNDSKMTLYARQNNPFFRDLPVYLGLITSIFAFATLIISLTN
ncbi:MAG: polysaccharide biosynthesis/export family protein [Bacteroidota bacterium]